MPKTNALLGGRAASPSEQLRELSALLPVARDAADRASTPTTTTSARNQPPSGGYAKLAPTLSNTLPVWLAEGRLPNRAHRQVPERLRHAIARHRGPAGLDRVVRLARRPRRLQGGTYTMYGYTLNENGSIVHYGSTPDVVDPGDLPDRRLLGQGAPTSSAAARRRASRSSSRSPPLASHSEGGKATTQDNNPRAAPRHEGSLAGELPPSNPAFNEADVSDKPQAIRDLNPMNAAQQAAGRDALPRAGGVAAGGRRDGREHRRRR